MDEVVDSVNENYSSRKIEIDVNSVHDSIISFSSEMNAGVCTDHGNTGKTLSECDLETVWNGYWDKYGEYLVWEGWVVKYPTQTDLKVQAVPAIAEVEVAANDVEEEIVCQNTKAVKLQANNSGEVIVCSDGDMEKDGPNKNMNIDKMTYRDYNESYEKLNSGQQVFKHMDGSDIVTTMQRQTELAALYSNANDGSIDTDVSLPECDNTTNERCEMLNTMHSYSSINKTDASDTVENTGNVEVYHDSCEVYDEKLNSEEYNKAWESLWNEHYMESYWYYYSQFAEKFQAIVSNSSTKVVTENSVISEGIAVVNENGELEIVEPVHQQVDENSDNLYNYTNDENIGNTDDVKKLQEISDSIGAIPDSATDLIVEPKPPNKNIVYVIEDESSTDNENGKLLYVIESENGEVDLDTLASVMKDVQLKDGMSVVTECSMSDKSDPCQDGVGDEGTHGNALESVHQHDDHSVEFNRDVVGDVKINENEPVDGSRKKRKQRERWNEQQQQQSSQQGASYQQKSRCGKIIRFQ